MTRPIRLALPAALALGVALAVSACAPQRLQPRQAAAPAPSAGAPAAPEAPAAGPVPVALLVPLGASDSTVASQASAIANAARLAAGGDAARRISLKTYDTGTDPARAGAAARQAVAEGAQLILGPLFGAQTPAVAQAVAPRGVRVISFSTDSSIAGDPVYVSGYLPEVEAERILGFASRQGLGSVAVYAPDTPYGRAAATGAEEAARRTGTYVTARSLYPRSFQAIQDSSQGFASEARSSGAQAVLLPDSGDGLKIAASFLDYNGLAPDQVKYLGLGQWETPATLTEPSLRGGWFAGADPADVRAFGQDYAAVYGSTPPFVAVLGYDAVRVADQLVAEARARGDDRPFDPEDITRPQGFRGALGPLVFEPDGTARRALAVLEVGRSDFTVIEPAPMTAGAGL